MKGFLSFLPLAVLALSASGADYVVSKEAERVIPAKSSQGQHSVMGNLAGQFRTVFANMLWMKADVYHHEFIESNPNWGEDKDLLPLMRMITWLDPHFTQAYASGGWILGMYQGKAPQARVFLTEGAKNNPTSFEMHEVMGLIAWRQDKNNKGALAHFKEARRLAADEFDQTRLDRSIQSLSEQVKTGYVSGIQPLGPIQKKKSVRPAEGYTEKLGPPDHPDGHNH